MALVASASTEQQDLLDFQRRIGHDEPPVSPIPLPSPAPKPSPRNDTIPSMISALEIMQNEYFEVWQGIWPTGNDWTTAVMATHVSAALQTWNRAEQSPNILNRYFSQLVTFYYGQHAFSLRQQAFDDMLWVVLGWLETIHFTRQSAIQHKGPDSWYGEQHVPAFAHRARIFWELASQGWDTKFCQGGMIWSPYLTPYKNAITNELYIAASISMYLHFPGDDIDYPFISDRSQRERDPKYLAAAIETYRWLSQSNMTNDRGLYVDGYHISRWADRSGNGSHIDRNCDIRNEMLYTYNQGVLLTGQRGLYEATGAKSYLEDGHALIEAVINATGYNLANDLPFESRESLTNPSNLGRWWGLGRHGVMEEFCDSSARCSQDSQTFKGIFFHHFTAFCARLPDQLALHHLKEVVLPDEIAAWHKEMCVRYTGWVQHNSQAALSTLNQHGQFGMWWGAPPGSPARSVDEVSLPVGAVDYRNEGTPRTSLWQRLSEPGAGFPLTHDDDTTIRRGKRHGNIQGRKASQGRDANDRGRGRTVETQAGGLAVLRALWELEHGL